MEYEYRRGEIANYHEGDIHFRVRVLRVEGDFDDPRYTLGILEVINDGNAKRPMPVKTVFGFQANYGGVPKEERGFLSKIESDNLERRSTNESGENGRSIRRMPGEPQKHMGIPVSPGNGETLGRC